MAGTGEEGSGGRHDEGPVACAAWIFRRTEKQHYYARQRQGAQQQQQQRKNLVVMGRPGSGGATPALEIFDFDPKTASLSSYPLAECVIDGDPLGLAVHPSGEEVVCATAKGCRLFELQGHDSDVKLLAKDLPPLQAVSRQKCLSFSTDGSKFATGGEDGHLRIFEWPSLQVILDEPKAHKSFRDMDISLDSEFLASTSTDGSARIWKISDGVPLASLTRNSDEKIECCRFSRDGTKPFLFCTVKKGKEVVTAVGTLATGNKIGYKRLLRKPISTLSISLDGKYLALGSNDGDICVLEIKKMEICHWSKKLHLGTSISAIEFCPMESMRLPLSFFWDISSCKFENARPVENCTLHFKSMGAMVTKLNVPADWKEWQIYLLLLGLFLASLVVFYIIYENSDSFWNFPLGRDQPARPSLLKHLPVIPRP